MSLEASTFQANLPQAQVTYYDRKFRENLKQQTVFVACSERLDLPLNSGNKIELFMYETYGTDAAGSSYSGIPSAAQQVAPSQASEGFPGNGIAAPTVLTKTMTIGEYSDNCSFSSLSLATALDKPVESVGREMAYRLGEGLSALVRVVVDGGVSVDSSVQVELPAVSTSSYTALTRPAIVSAVQSMAGRAIRPFLEAEKRFQGVISPFALGDVQIDPSNDSPINILKHTAIGLARMEELVSTDLTETVEFPSTGVVFFQTQLVTSTLNYKSITGATALRTYIFGKDGVFSCRLAAPGDTEYNDGRYEGIRVYLKQNAEPSVADQAGLIPGWTSFRCHFVASLGPDVTLRYRFIDAVSAIS